MKLTTKLALIYLAVSVVVGAGLGLFGIPYVRSAIEERERNYAISFLERESQITWVLLKGLEADGKRKGLSDEEMDVEREKFFKELEEAFTKFYFHNSGRLFVVDNSGKIWVSSDPTKNGRTVSNMWIYEDGGRDRLMNKINSIKGAPDLVRNFLLEDVNKVKKRLFVSSLPGRQYYVCISVNNGDLYYSANWISRAALLLLAILILLLYLLFHVFYSGMRKRYDAIIEHAERIAKGNYDLVIDDHSADEVGILARTIDNLAENLRQQKSLENQLHQVQKMEMVGILASGIAHDFNNTLGGIMSGLELVAQEMNAPANKESADLDLIKNTIRVTTDCANRGKETVEKLVSFSRKSETMRKVTDLNRCVRNVEELCQHSFDKRITVKVHLPKDKSLILADRSHLEQAILNICINARDAMANGGKLEIQVHPERKANPKDSGDKPVSCHLLEIRDTGGGMSGKTIERIFEPFYTTKRKGTGLGLAMVYRAVSDHEGWVELDSEVGTGTTFRIYLPQASGEHQDPADTGRYAPATAPGSKPKPRVKAAPTGGNETILVIDDDTFMLQMTEDILARLGYKTVVAADGEEGIATFTQNKDNLDLVLLDLMLPKISGDEVFVKIRELVPDVPVLLISGHKRDPRIADLLAKGCNEFLNKPYTIEDLSKSVRKTIDDAKAAKATDAGSADDKGSGEA